MAWDGQLREGIGFGTTARGGSRGRRGQRGIIDQILKWPIHLIFNISECALDLSNCIPRPAPSASLLFLSPLWLFPSAPLYPSSLVSAHSPKVPRPLKAAFRP
jgi:hypothetical protein